MYWLLITPRPASPPRPPTYVYDKVRALPPRRRIRRVSAPHTCAASVGRAGRISRGRTDRPRSAWRGQQRAARTARRACGLACRPAACARAPRRVGRRTQHACHTGTGSRRPAVLEAVQTSTQCSAGRQHVPAACSLLQTAHRRCGRAAAVPPAERVRRAASAPAPRTRAARAAPRNRDGIQKAGTTIFRLLPER